MFLGPIKRIISAIDQAGFGIASYKLGDAKTGCDIANMRERVLFGFLA